MGIDDALVIRQRNRFPWQGDQAAPCQWQDCPQSAQKAFINEMSTGQLGRGRLQADTLNNEEQKEFRSVAGSLQWLGGQTRPDLCSAVSLANKGAETRPKDLKTLLDYIDLAKLTPDLGIRFNAVPFNKAAMLIGYGDSSWANAPGGGFGPDRITRLP